MGQMPRARASWPPSAPEADSCKRSGAAGLEQFLLGMLPEEDVARKAQQLTDSPGPPEKTMANASKGTP